MLRNLFCILRFSLLFLIFTGTTFAGKSDAYHQYLRESQIETDFESVRKLRAKARAALRWAGRKKNFSVVKTKQELSGHSYEELKADVLSASVGSETVNRALELYNYNQSRNFHDIELDIFTAVALWEAGKSDQARELSLKLLANNEKPLLHRFLYQDELSQRNFKNALFHLRRADFGAFQRIIAEAQIFWHGRTQNRYLVLITILIAIFFIAQKMLRKSRTSDDESTGLPISLIPEPEVLFDTLPVVADTEAEALQLEEFSVAAVVAISELNMSTENSDAGESEYLQSENHSKHRRESSESLESSERILSDAFIEGLDHSEADETANNIEIEKAFASSAASLSDCFTGILEVATRKMVRVIGVISDGQESNICLQTIVFAKLFAQYDFKTLLVEYNSDQNFSAAVGCQCQPGISDCKSIEDLETIIQKVSSSKNLYYLPAGTDFSHEFIGSERAKDCQNYFKERFDITVIFMPECRILQKTKINSDTVSAILSFSSNPAISCLQDRYSHFEKVDIIDLGHYEIS